MNGRNSKTTTQTTTITRGKLSRRARRRRARIQRRAQGSNNQGIGRIRTIINSRRDRRRGLRRVNAPIASSMVSYLKRPSFSNERGGTVVIEHTEFLADVSSHTTFLNTSYNINPGLSSTFPWLSSIAANYESYSFEELEVVYKAGCATTTPGFVILATDYDAIDPDYTSKMQAMSGPNINGPAWRNIVHKSNFHNLHKFKQYYVRTGSILESHDLKTYDVAKLQIITGGQENNSTTLGSLLIHYKVRLITPQMNMGSGNAEQTSVHMINNAGFSGSNMLGTPESMVINSNTQPIFIGGDTIISNQAADWLTVLSWAATALTGAITTTALGGAVIHAIHGAVNTLANELVLMIAWTAPFVTGALPPFRPRLTLSSANFGADVVNLLHAPYVLDAGSSFYHNSINTSWKNGNKFVVEMFGKRSIPKTLDSKDYKNFSSIIKNYTNERGGYKVKTDNELFLSSHPILKGFLFWSEKKNKFVDASVIKEEMLQNIDHEYDKLEPICIKNLFVDEDPECSECTLPIVECKCYQHLQ